MPVIVKRYGGLVARPPKVKSTPWEEIDEATEAALADLMADGDPSAPSEPVPDGFSYTFETDRSSDAGRKVTLQGMRVPDALRKLLP